MSEISSDNYCDVVIVGAGPAGLSAALILGRCCRNILVCDDGTPRSWASKEMHGFVSRDGVHPQTFRDLARADLSQYENVRFWEGEVVDIERKPQLFEVSLATGRKAHARKVLIATGLFDELPRIPGINEFFGRSVFQCPYCDGWEFRGQQVAVYGRGDCGFDMARAMTAWSREILLCTDGPSGLSLEQKAQLCLNGIRLIDQQISRLEGSNGQMTAIVFADNSRNERSALFFDLPCHPQSTLTKKVGCSFTQDGRVQCGKYEATSVPGVYIAGNIVGDVQLSIVAAAEGAKAAFGINKALTREDFDRNASGLTHNEHPVLKK